MSEKKCLIVETLNPISLLEKSTENKDGLIRVSGCFGVCGIVNDNGRTYNKANYNEQVKQLQNKITKESLLGELEHPNSMNINLENVSHKIESIEMRENGEVWGTICLANTPKGKIAQAIVEMGAPLYISSRAKGRIDERGNVTLDELKTYDLVGTPGFSQAILKKSQTYEALNESLGIIIENENNINDNNTMTNDKTVVLTEEQYASFVNLTETVKALTDKIEAYESKHENLVESISDFFNDEVLPEINSVKENCIEETQNWITNDFAPIIENWVVNEYSPMLESYMVEEFAPEVQNWVVNEYSPMLESYMVEEFAPEVQNWVVNEYSSEVNNWAENEVIPEIYSKVQEKLDESLKVKDENKLNSIDETLKLLENMSANNNNKNLNINVKNEDDVYESLEVIKSMPAKFRTLWNASTEDIKKSILERAKVYNFTSAAVVERFWNNIDFNKVAINVNTINENVTEYENNLRKTIRAFRKL